MAGVVPYQPSSTRIGLAQGTIGSSGKIVPLLGPSPDKELVLETGALRDDFSGIGGAVADARVALS